VIDGDVATRERAIMTDDAITFIAQQVSRETRIAYEKDLRRWFLFGGGVEPNTAKYDTVVAFRDHLAASFAPATAARCFSTVRSYARWRIQIGRSERNPFDAVKRPRRTRNQAPVVPADSVIDALVAESRKDPLAQAVIALLLNGLRASEAAGLRRGLDGIRYDEDNDGYLMTVIGKGAVERTIPMMPEALEALQRFWQTPAAFGVPSPYAVYDVYGKPFTNMGIYHIVASTARRAGVEHVHPHALRHHFGTRLSDAGVDINVIRELMGHASVSTTQQYLTVSKKRLFEAMDKDPRKPSKDKLRAVS
jgi:site-specific recombinase XerD